MGLPGSCDANLGFLRKIDLGYTAGQLIESVACGLLLGIDCVEDMDMMCGDPALDKILGYKVPSIRCVRDFLEKFHDQELVSAARDKAAELELKASIPDLSDGLRSLQNILGTSARSAASRHPEVSPASAPPRSTTLAVLGEPQVACCSCPPLLILMFTAAIRARWR